MIGNLPKKFASRYYQLKVGHGVVGTFLAKIGVIETPIIYSVKMSPSLLSSQGGSTGTIRAKRAGEGESRVRVPGSAFHFYVFFFLFSHRFLSMDISNGIL